MKRISTVLLVVFIIMSACSGENKPATSDLKKALTLHLPGHVSLNSFSVEASQNLGNKVEPLYAVRFQAAVKAMVDLYKEDGSENGVRFVSLVSDKGKKADIFGKITSRLYQGAWQHNIDIDGNPFAALGTPLTQFPGGRVIIRGSNEEKSYYAEVERKNKEIKAEAERRESELRANIANAQKILIGTWRDDNSLITYKTDGSRVTKFDSGNTIFSKWQLDGDLIVRRDEMSETKAGKSVPLNRTWRVKILYIDNNKYTIKDDAGTWNAKRVK
jgi:hypothetical protein